MSLLTGVTLAFVLGFVSLASEILWYRAYTFVYQGHAQAFGILLGGYLFGIAVGACVVFLNQERVRRVIPWVIAAAGVFGYSVIPTTAALRQSRLPAELGIVIVAVAAAASGALFPALCDIAIKAQARASAAVGYVYAANIVGCASGSLVTGFVLLDRMTTSQLAPCLALAQILTAALVVPVVQSSSRKRFFAWSTLGGVASLLLVATPALFSNLYPRLMGPRYASLVFQRVVENRVGVIAVTDQQAVFGDGVYDGVVNVDLRHNSRNAIDRAYLVGALHPQPKRVLLIGLSTGSWASVLAAHAAVEELTIVEINPGYQEIVASSPAVSAVLKNPKVHLEFGDGRRWLERHPDDRFDVIVANTVYHWRANAARLLSREFLQTVRQHLSYGGVYYFNTTGSDRAAKTALAVFPYGWGIENMVAVSDEPFDVNLERFRQQVEEFRVDGQPSLDLSHAEDRSLLNQIVVDVRRTVETRDSILGRARALATITDDNMGHEWVLPDRYRVF